MWRALIAAPLLTACAVTNIDERLGITDDRPPPPDNTLAAIMSAEPRTCPPGRALEGAHHEAFGPQHGVTSEDIGSVPVAGNPSRVVRMRRLVIEPGGVIAWHAHTGAQGMAMIVSGEATEIRNSCMDMIAYRAGDVALEDAGTAHGWRNDGAAPAVVLVAHVVAQN
jgi:quercetin dioxygenase-like cupin family protein